MRHCPLFGKYGTAGNLGIKSGKDFMISPIQKVWKSSKNSLISR